MENKLKNQSRRKTHKIVTGSWGMRKFEIKNISCKVCKKEKDLEIHHEIYPISAYEIKKAICKKKIYYLCFECHKMLHKGQIIKLLRKYSKIGGVNGKV